MCLCVFGIHNCKYLNVIGILTTTTIDTGNAETAPSQSDTEGDGGGGGGVTHNKDENVPQTFEQLSTGSSSLTSSASSVTTCKLSQFDNKVRQHGETLLIMYTIMYTSPPSLSPFQLADHYGDKANQRMSDKQDRRQCYADIDMQSTEKFGLLCSPFQALQLVVRRGKERERERGGGEEREEEESE